MKTTICSNFNIAEVSGMPVIILWCPMLFAVGVEMSAFHKTAKIQAQEKSLRVS